MRRLLGLLLIAILAIAGTLLKERSPEQSAARPEQKSAPRQQSGAEASPAKLPRGQAAGYVLSLSWSPAFCASRDPDGESDQCETGAQRGLVVHGLWPNGRQEYCDTNEPRRLSDDVARDVLRYMPSLGLARHEWEKHGSCSGFTQRDYFAATERAWKAFRQPPLLARPSGEQRVDRNGLLNAIASSNPGMPSSALALQCGKGGVLKEIRLCLDGTLSPRPCPADTRRSCSGTVTILPPL